MNKKSYTYILECSDKTLYTWFTTNLEKRVFEHNNSKNWAKYTKWKRPVKLVYFEEFMTKSEAQSREYQIKKLKRLDKLELIKSNKNLQNNK